MTEEKPIAPEEAPEAAPEEAPEETPEKAPEKAVEKAAEKAPEKAEKPKAPKEPMKRAEGNVVFIGIKPVMNYVIACLTVFNAGEQQVCVKARGRAISRAVDTIELLRRSFVKDLGLLDIKLGTEEMTSTEGRRSNVSTIEITVKKA